VAYNNVVTISVVCQPSRHPHTHFPPIGDAVLKKFLSLFIAISLSCVVFNTRLQAQAGKDAQTANRIKADVAAIGVGARVSISPPEFPCFLK
jgi:hypothetical protein